MNIHIIHGINPRAPKGFNNPSTPNRNKLARVGAHGRDRDRMFVTCEPLLPLQPALKSAQQLGAWIFVTGNNNNCSLIRQRGLERDSLYWEGCFKLNMCERNSRSQVCRKLHGWWLHPPWIMRGLEGLGGAGSGDFSSGPGAEGG